MHFRIPTVLIAFLVLCAINSNSMLCVRAEENAAVSITAPAVMLYQVAFKSIRPVAGITIGEYSTGEVLASWSSSGNASSSGQYYLQGPAGERYLLSITDSGDGGQFVSITSRFANMMRVKIKYPDSSTQEIVPDFPIVLFNCTMENMSTCSPGGTLTAPYQDCARVFSGYIELVVTHTGGTWKEFEQNVLQPLKAAGEWSAGDVYTLVFRKLDKGFYAEVRITAPSCLQSVVQKLHGNPAILSMKGRQLIVNYKTAVQPPASPALPAPASDD